MSTIALVTGANKGLGLEITRQLAERGCTVFLGARDLSKGEAAAEHLRKAGFDVRAILLDMENPETFSTVERIEIECGKLDILVNNAGFAIDWAYQADTVPMEMIRTTYETNFFRLIELTQKLLPLLRRSPAGRIVNHSSGLGSLTLHSMANSPFDSLKAFAYNSSKTALNAFTVHLAFALRDTPIKVNSADPGSVKTDANPNGILDVTTGAKTAVELALLPPDGPTGGFFHLGQPVPW